MVKTNLIRRVALRGFSPLYYCRKYFYVMRNWRTYRLRRERYVELKRTAGHLHHGITRTLEHSGWAPLQFDELKVRRLVEQCNAIDAAKPVEAQQDTGGKNFWTIILKGGEARQYPDLIGLVREQYFKDIATLYMGEEAVLSDVSLIHSFPTGRMANHSQLWHLDADDTKVLIFYVYCSDVDEEAGPFVLATRNGVKFRFVPRFLRKHGYADEDFKRIYQPKEIKAITGKAGTVFVCDTGNTLHFGSRCASKHRLAFSFRYTTFSGLYPVHEVL